MQSFLFLILFTFFARFTSAFNFISAKSNHRTKTLLKSIEGSEDYLEDVYGLLDLNKPKEVLLEEQSLIENKSLIKRPKSIKKVTEEIKDINDVDFNGKESWMLEIRDAMEQRLGVGLWSGKSTQQIQMETKRAQAQKGQNIPDSVRRLIEEVFIEKTIRMKDFQKSHKLQFIEYRKWLTEQKQKQKNNKVKKNILMNAKLDVSKRWLRRAPSMIGIDLVYLV